MMTARWVEGDHPDNSPYIRTGSMDKSAAPFRVQACHRKIRKKESIRTKTQNAPPATMPMCSPEMARI